ncbi:MAG: recombinase family protein [Thermoplasmatota archaeon]
MFEAGGERMKAAAYYRVSTDKQDLANQEAEIARAAEARGLELVKRFEDIESGAAAGRHGLADMLQSARKREFDTLIVMEMSRLTRGGIGALFHILSELKACGVSWVSVREPFLSVEGPVKDILLAIVGWVAEQERILISQRTKSALARRRALARACFEAKGLTGCPDGCYCKLRLGRRKGQKDARPRIRRWKKRPGWLAG